MVARVHVPRWLLVLVLVLWASLVVGLVAGCGSSDKFEGTWVDVKDSKSALEITKKDDTTYTVADPDGSNEFTAKVSSDGNSLNGSINLAKEGDKPLNADVTLTLKGDDGMTFAVTAGGQNISYDLKKK